MGKYVNQTDLRAAMSDEELRQMTDDGGSGLVDTAVVERVIGEAEAEVDGYLSARYPLPLPSVPELVRRLTVDVTVYRLYARRKFSDETVRRRYEDAVKLLVGLSVGRVSLGLADPPASESGAARGTLSAADRLFTKTSLGGF